MNQEFLKTRISLAKAYEMWPKTCSEEEVFINEIQLNNLLKSSQPRWLARYRLRRRSGTALGMFSVVLWLLGCARPDEATKVHGSGISRLTRKTTGGLRQSWLGRKCECEFGKTKFIQAAPATKISPVFFFFWISRYVWNFLHSFSCTFNTLLLSNCVHIWKKNEETVGNPNEALKECLCSPQTFN